MTEQELRAKIVGILYSKTGYTNIISNYTELADALIAAEIGDVSEWKHRAEVAERALDFCECAYLLALNGLKHVSISQEAITSDLGIHKFFIQKAEKELQEERKNVR